MEEFVIIAFQFQVNTTVATTLDSLNWHTTRDTPNNSSLEGGVGGYNIVFIQHYTPFVKAREEKVPLTARPHLLTYLLGRQYVRRQSQQV